MQTTTDLRSYQPERSEVQPQPTLVEGTPEDAPISRLNRATEAPQDVYKTLRDHQQQASEKLRLLHTYLPLINNRFYGGQLPLPALSWDIDHWRSLACYREKDGLALHHRINLNLLYADRPLAEILRSLTHELGHLWQQIYGKPPADPNLDHYHNSEFRRKMSEIGIPCNKHGVSLGIEAPFVSFLKEVGVEADATPFKREGQTPTDGPTGAGSRKGSHLRPWACSCTRVWASVRTKVDSTCNKCGSKFSEAVVHRR